MGASASIDLTSSNSIDVRNILRTYTSYHDKLVGMHPNHQWPLHDAADDSGLVSTLNNPAYFLWILHELSNVLYSDIMLKYKFDPKSDIDELVELSAMHKMYLDSVDNAEEESVNDAVREFIASEQSASQMMYSINAECISLEALGIFNRAFNGFQQATLIGLNVSNNQISAQSIQDSHLSLSAILSFSAGGNPSITNSLSTLCSNLPMHLLVLDLSFTNNLVIAPGTFLSCFQLVKLVLDGCDISSTTIDASDDDGRSCAVSSMVVGKQCRGSVFYGLVSLRELSLKENQISSVEALRGLSFFNHPLNWGDATMSSLRALIAIHLADNPIHDISSTAKAALEFLQSAIPSLETIDGKPLMNHRQQNSNSTFRPSSVLPADVREVSDAMEAEFLSAIRGEKDVSIVS